MKMPPCGHWTDMPQKRSREKRERERLSMQKGVRLHVDVDPRRLV